MFTWRRPFGPRLLAGLLIAAITWALLSSHTRVHGTAMQRGEDAAGQPASRQQMRPSRE